MSRKYLTYDERIDDIITELQIRRIPEKLLQKLRNIRDDIPCNCEECVDESNIVIEQIEDSLRLCKEIKTILPLFKGGMKENPALYLMINGIERDIKEIKVMEEGK